MLKYPCKDCPDRKLGCQGYCRKYLDVKEQNLQEHNKIVEQKMKEKIANEARSAGYKRMTSRAKKSDTCVTKCHKR